METEFLEDPSYAIREREMEKIHSILSRNREYEGKSIFLKKMVYALIDASKVVPKMSSTLHIETHIPQREVEHEHLEFQRSRLETPRARVSWQVPRVSSATITPSVAKSPVLMQKIQERLSAAKIPPGIPQVQVAKPEVRIPRTQIQPQIKPNLEQGIPIPTPPKPKGSFGKAEDRLQKPSEVKLGFPVPPTQIETKEIGYHKFDINDLLPPSPPKLESGIRVGLEEQKPKVEKMPRPKIEQKIEPPRVVSSKREIVSIEDLPEIGEDEGILKIRSTPEDEQKYMPPQEKIQRQPAVDIREVAPEVMQEKKPAVSPQIQQIQPTMMKIDRPQKQAFEIEHHAPEKEYKELEPIEKRFIPLGAEIELQATPIQRKAQSILPPPPKPTGGQVSKTDQVALRSVSFLDINPRSGVREMEGNILYEVADPFSSPLQEVFEFIRLNVFVNPSKINDSKFLDESFKKMSKQLNITIQDKDKKEILTKVSEHINGFGRIKDMLSDPSVSAIYCNGLNRPISIDFKLIGRIQTNVLYQDKLELERLIKNMVRMAGKTITESNPIIETLIPPNIQLEATLGGDFISSKFVIKKK